MNCTGDRIRLSRRFSSRSVSIACNTKSILLRLTDPAETQERHQSIVCTTNILTAVASVKEGLPGCCRPSVSGARQAYHKQQSILINRGLPLFDTCKISSSKSALIRRRRVLATYTLILSQSINNKTEMSAPTRETPLQPIPSKVSIGPT